jgi:iron only hydrogenase large subunit-like protein
VQVDGETVLKFALCYGFSNLSKIVQKMKTGKSDYHFLEIMACPSGTIFLDYLDFIFLRQPILIVSN